MGIRDDDDELAQEGRPSIRIRRTLAARAPGRCRRPPSAWRQEVPFSHRSSGGPELRSKSTKLHLSHLPRWRPPPTPDSPPHPWTLTTDGSEKVSRDCHPSGGR